MLDPTLQLALREPPLGRPVMRQSWRDLLFLHFPCDTAEIQKLLPTGLAVDTFPDSNGIERAWIGLVPFLMTGVRWHFAPPVPWTHTFPETNVRTHVHRDGQEPGVWFFSLDAMNHLAVQTARRFFNLPYFSSRMNLEKNGDLITYSGARPAANYRIQAEIGVELPAPQPGSLEFFLVERYLLYAVRNRQLLTGRVHHQPYRLHAARVLSLEESLVSVAGITPQPFVHALYSPGVDVNVFPLRPH